MKEGTPEHFGSYEEIVAEYPFLADWLSSHETAQLLNGKRLLSAEEKMERFGGIEQVRRNLEEAIKRKRIKPIILQACRDGAMVGYEVMHFAEMIGQKIGPTNFWTSVYELEHEDNGGGKVIIIKGITYIARRSYSGGLFRVKENNRGILTTDEGTKALAVNLYNKETQDLPRELLRPKPQTS